MRDLSGKPGAKWARRGKRWRWRPPGDFYCVISGRVCAGAKGGGERGRETLEHGEREREGTTAKLGVLLKNERSEQGLNELYP